MIQSNSVRVGNLVSVNGSDYFSYINEIYKGSAVISRGNKESILVAFCYLYGVPLTVDMIGDLQSGFMIKIEEPESDKLLLFLQLGKYDVLINYVHELQNLYYAIYKKELDVSKILK